VWIEILLLSRLDREPMHGYELRKAIEASTGHTLSNNSLYPTLRRFVDAGAVSRSAEEQEAKPPRHVYTITDVGRELLHDMLADFPAELALSEEEFLARVGSFSRLDPPERARVLDVRKQALTTEHARLTALAAGQADPWGRAALRHVLGKLDAELRWLADLETELRRDA
jgi:DNA-binding PadR family transcriptional regulator